jgi:hypothetical protein
MITLVLICASVVVARRARANRWRYRCRFRCIGGSASGCRFWFRQRCRRQKGKERGQIRAIAFVRCGGWDSARVVSAVATNDIIICLWLKRLVVVVVIVRLVLPIIIITIVIFLHIAFNLVIVIVNRAAM